MYIVYSVYISLLLGGRLFDTPNILRPRILPSPLRGSTNLLSTYITCIVQVRDMYCDRDQYSSMLTVEASAVTLNRAESPKHTILETSG